MADAMEIQSDDVARWKTVLNETAFAALVEKVDAVNAAGYNSPYDVYRGGSIDQYIANLMRGNR